MDPQIISHHRFPSGAASNVQSKCLASVFMPLDPSESGLSKLPTILDDLRTADTGKIYWQAAIGPVAVAWTPLFSKWHTGPLNLRKPRRSASASFGVMSHRRPSEDPFTADPIGRRRVPRTIRHWSLAALFFQQSTESPASPAWDSAGPRNSSSAVSRIRSTFSHSHATSR